MMRTRVDPPMEPDERARMIAAALRVLEAERVWLPFRVVDSLVVAILSAQADDREGRP